ncbi:chorion peroxidase [Plakobranchus ocellatus]|uniref:Chorion peroxidase n=1 Tax=Plakobranchus ocellatus TaxID=259542 RepID=A0AAV3Z2I3_9GAST|nr:chorion peroxidase [Plakobranchus ocellatus]
MRVFALLLLALAYLANQATAEKIAAPARVDGRLTGHVTFSEQVLLHREKRQGRGRRPPQGNRRPPARTRPPTAPPTTALPTNAPTNAPTDPPTDPPTIAPTIAPTNAQTNAPTNAPTNPPTNAPTNAPTNPPTSPPSTSGASVSCGTEFYRSADGSCNNVVEPTWGAKDSAFRRMLQPVYSSNNGPVLNSTVDGTPLPSPRLISRIIHDPENRPERRPVMSMQWGQFLDHDITSTPVNPDEEKCCYDGIIASGVQQHPDVAVNGPCFPIFIPTGDNHFTSLEARCMECKRSYQTIVNAEQINLATAFIDGSQVYGSTDSEMEELRSNALGRGRLLDINDHLPKGADDVCVVSDNNVDYCLKADHVEARNAEVQSYGSLLSGDSRVNVYPGLGALHTVFLRMHNRIADGLAAVNSDWTDDEVFNEARRIVGALLQKITYSEWLPSVLGPAAMATYRLSSTVDYKYEPGTNPTLYNVFSTAAFR